MLMAGLLGTGSLEAAPLSTLPPTTAPAESAPASGMVWKITAPGGAVHYLGGSIHLLPGGTGAEAGVGGLPPAFRRAYAAARALVFETDIDAATRPEMQFALLRDGRNTAPAGLRSTLPPPLATALVARLDADGAPETLCDPLTAWLCAMLIEQNRFARAGFTGENGTDMRLFQRASDDGKAIGWFESPAMQAALLTGLTPVQARDMLASTLETQDRPEAEPQNLLRAWQRADLAVFERLDKEFHDEDPVLHARLLTARNRAWAMRLDTDPTLPGTGAGGATATGPWLIVVGAAHLVGPDGLPNLLRRRGWRVEPLESLPITPAPGSGREGLAGSATTSTSHSLPLHPVAPVTGGIPHSRS